MGKHASYTLLLSLVNKIFKESDNTDLYILFSFVYYFHASFDKVL